MSLLNDAKNSETAAGSLFREVCLWLAVIGGLGTVAMMVVIVLDVVGRGVFGTPFPATAEIISASIVGIVFLQLPYCTILGRNIRSAMLIDILRGKNRSAVKYMEITHHFVGAMMLGVIAYFAVPEIIEIISDRETVGIHGVLKLPRWPFVLPVAVGAFLTTIAFVVLTVRYTCTQGEEEIGNE